MHNSVLFNIHADASVNSVVPLTLPVFEYRVLLIKFCEYDKLVTMRMILILCHINVC